MFLFYIHQIVQIKALNLKFIQKHRCDITPHSGQYQENMIKTPTFVFNPGLKCTIFKNVCHYRKSYDPFWYRKKNSNIAMTKNPPGFSSLHQLAASWLKVLLRIKDSVSLVKKKHTATVNQGKIKYEDRLLLNG